MTYFDQELSNISDGMLDIIKQEDSFTDLFIPDFFKELENFDNSSSVPSYVKDLNISNGNKVRIVFSEVDCKVSASLIMKDGESVMIPEINYPTEFSLIKTSDALSKFLENAYARVSILDDDEPKLYVFQKGYGGSGKGQQININTPKPPVQQPTTPQPPVSVSASAGVDISGKKVSYGGQVGARFNF